ncbi:hypothetical protein EVJ50_01055 [Synechococcus sp. RSCCF101]|uniref:hypothetical protein n=1 Tax=Synechococcus sp. RSCCF101 TaxID=2511069 RepID=UPI0012478D83|nr:hypothetical protein [Synechococcus sp. RSCCF101]QEY31047.1 hypothetical protein EVJ50_01055 [Synechococcus sp. RSCCF101]
MGSIVSALLILSLLPIQPARTALLSRVGAAVNRCLQTSDPSICRRALIELEALQRAAERASRYPCQTQALGLGADMLMQAEQVDRRASTSELLRSLQRECGGL